MTDLQLPEAGQTVTETDGTVMRFTRICDLQPGDVYLGGWPTEVVRVEAGEQDSFRVVIQWPARGEEHAGPWHPRGELFPVIISG